MSLENQYYLLLIKEDKYGLEKSSEGRIDGLEEYKDYMITDASEGQIGVPDLYEVSDATFCGSSSVDINKYILQPEETLLTNLQGFKFINGMYCDEVKELNEEVIAHTLTSKRDINSFSLYAGGIYSDHETFVRGNQINELSMEFETEGKVGLSLSTYGQKDELRTLKATSALPSISEPIRSYNIKGFSYRKYNKDAMIDEEWIDIGCSVKSGSLSINQNIEEDTGFSFCNSIYSSGYLASKEKEVSMEVTLSQNKSLWREMFYGGSGVASYNEMNYYSIKMHIVTDEGRKMNIILPRCYLTLDTGSMDSNPEETLTFNAVTGDLIITPIGSLDEKRTTGLLTYIYDDKGIGNDKGLVEVTASDHAHDFVLKRIDAEGNRTYVLIKTVEPGKPLRVSLEVGKYAADVDGTGETQHTLTKAGLKINCQDTVEDPKE